MLPSTLCRHTETPPTSSFALCLGVKSSAVTELAQRFADDAIGHFAKPYIHLFHNIPDADNVAHITENVKAALAKWGESEKQRRGEGLQARYGSVQQLTEE